MASENSIITAAEDLLDKISLISHFPSKVRSIRNKISPDKLRLLILQKSRQSQDNFTVSPTSQHDR